MTPSLSDIGTQAIQDLIGNLTGAKAFVLDQAPEVAQQFIAYNLVFSSCATAALTAIFIAVTIAVWKTAISKAEDEYKIVVFVLSAFAIPISITGIVINANTLIKCSIAPKYFLLTELMELIK